MNTQHMQPSKAPASQLGRCLFTWMRRSAWVLIPALYLLATSGTANATATIGVVEWITFPSISVASNGQNYTTAGGLGSGWGARFMVEASGASRVKNWNIHPTIKASGIPGLEGISDVDLSDHQVGKSYSFGKRPKVVHKTVGNSVPSSAVSGFAAAVCNRNLDNLMGQGQTKQQVLGQDRTVAVHLNSHLSFTPTYGDTLQEVIPDQTLEITCEKSPFNPVPSGPGGVTSDAEFILDNAQLDISPSQYEGQCPKDLTLTMEVQGSSSGNFEARIESTEGWQSTKVVLGTNEFHESTGLWGREFSEPFTLPLDYPGGGGALPQGPGNKAPNPGGKGTGSGGGMQGPGGLAPTDPGWNVHQASLRLVAKANGKTAYSEWQQYRVTCEPKIVIGTVSNDYLPGTGGSKPPKPGDDSKPDADKPGAKPGAKPATMKKGGKPTESSTGKSESSKSAASLGKSAGRETTKPKPKPAPKPTPKPTPKSKPTPSVAKDGRDLKAKPDLHVVEARTSAKRRGAIEFLVRNSGRAASAKSAARLSCGARTRDSQSWNAPLPAIAAGGQRWIVSSPGSSTRKLSAAPSAASCTIVLDPKNTVDETDERNNSHSCKDCRVGR